MKKEIELIVNELSDKKADDILVVNFEPGVHPVTDQIIIASSMNDIHLKSLVESLQRFYKNNKSTDLNNLDFLGVSGKPDSKWVIMDYNDLIIHLMDKEIRLQYDFDNLFAAYENYRYH
ncbi:MAG: ribosome silencing factor [Candidatus Margulisiibacteriota bacterium]